MANVILSSILILIVQNVNCEISLVCSSNFVSYMGFTVSVVDETLLSPSDTACAALCKYRKCASNSCQSATFRVDTSQCYLSNGTIEDIRYLVNDTFNTMVAVPSEMCLGRTCQTSAEALFSLAIRFKVLPSSTGLKKEPTDVRSTRSDGHRLNAMTEYYTGFLQNYDTYIPQLLIATSQRTLVSLYIPSLDILDTFVVDGTLVQSFAYELAHTADGDGGTKGIYLATNHPVSIYQYSNRPSSLEMAIVLPTSKTGKHYITVRSPNTDNANMFLLIGTEHDTEVSLTDSSTTVNITLNRLETYFRSGTDVISTIIEASADIVVLSGAPCSYIPIGKSYCDLVYETIPPTESYGTIFVVAYMYPRPDFTVAIVGNVDQTDVVIKNASGATIETLVVNRAESVYRDYFWEQTISVWSSQAILVSQFGHGGGSSTNDRYGDPSMMLIAPFENVQAEYTVVIPTDNDRNVIEIVTDDEANIRLNGSSVVYEHVVNITANDIYNVAYTYRTAGVYRITHVNSKPFALYLYGGGTYGEYATYAG